MSKKPRSKPSDPAAAHAVDERYLVPALIRGLRILGELSERRGGLSLSAVAAALGVTRSSAYRLLHTLEHLGFIIFDVDSKVYALGPQILHLGYGFLSSRDLVEIATPHLTRLRDGTGWSAHLGELQGLDVLYLARVPTRRSVASTVHVGTKLPAHATTMGRILLSGLSSDEVRKLYRDEGGGSMKRIARGGLSSLLEQLDQDRANGVVVQSAGYEPGVASVAAPIRDVANRIVAAINISAIALFTTEKELNGALKAQVLAAADAISRDLGRRGAASDEIGVPSSRKLLR